MQPSQGPSAAPLDLDHLDQQTLGDRELQAELLGLFAQQAQGIMEALNTSLRPEAGRHPRAAELLHTLCGSARAVGSWRVAAEAEDMERDLRSAETVAPEGRAKLLALGRSVGAVCAAIDDLSQR